MLMVPRFGSASPFVLLTRKLDESATLAPAIPRELRLKNLLSSYEDVFQAPSLSKTGASILGDLTPECIPVIPGSTSVNRSPFRLSLKEKTEIER